MPAVNQIDPWPQAGVSAPKVLLVSEPGGGKTHALRTLADVGIELFILFTEPGGSDVLADTDPDQVHWKYIAPANPSWTAMIDNARKINMMSYEDLSKIKSGMNKDQYAQFIELLNTLASFKCDRTGKTYCAVDQMTNRQAFALDSMSGLNIMCADLMTGAKPTRAQGEWGVSMDNEERLITKLCASTQCLFIMTAHLEPEVDEVMGTMRLMPGALGRKLAPKIPRFFSDVIHCKRTGAEFSWSTITGNVMLKARHLPWADNLPPSFVPLVNNWRAKQFTREESPVGFPTFTTDGTQAPL